jgi:hypothetical protein
MEGVRGDGRVVRALWPALAGLLAIYLLVDLVSEPLLGTSGVAAPPPRVMLWLSRTDADGAAAEVAQAAAAALGNRPRDAGVGVFHGGSSDAVQQFFDPARTDLDNAMLVVTSSTFSDLARERNDADVPGAAVDAHEAQRLLANATPIALLSSDPVLLAVPLTTSARTQRPDALLKQIRTAPSQRTWAIADDTFARGNLAALVQAAHGIAPSTTPGKVPFRVYPTQRDAITAVGDGAAGAALTTRSAIRSQRVAQRVRTIGWPPAAGAAPQAWVALVARPTLPASAARALRSRVAAIIASERWREQLRRSGRMPTSLAPERLRAFLGRARAAARDTQQVAASLERR